MMETTPINTFSGLMGVCTDVRQRLDDIATVHDSSVAALSELSNECFTIQAALLQVQAIGWYRDKLERVQGTELANAFDHTLDDTAILLSNLLRNLDDICSKAESQPEDAGLVQLVADELRHLWEEYAMKAFVEKLRKQHSELQFLLLAFHS
jgi:hypothetical protein